MSMWSQFDCPRCKGNKKMKKMYKREQKGYSKAGYPVSNWTSTDFYLCEKCDKVYHIAIKMRRQR